jgi:hypothetical protein
MGAMYERAVALAAALETAGFRIHPQPPHTNAFRVWADVPAEEINERIVTILETERLVLMPPMNPGEMPGTAWTEFTVNLSTLDWDVDEAVAAVGKLLG